MKFLGTLEELKAHLDAKLSGTWTGDDPYHFRPITGGLLRWWSNTRSVVIQGKPPQVARLQAVMKDIAFEDNTYSAHSDPSAAPRGGGAAGNSTSQQPRRRAIYTLKLEVVSVEHPDEDAG